MEMTKELLKKALAAKTPEELIRLAKAENEDLTLGEAEAAFAQLRKAGELTEETLDNVSGGAGILVIDSFNVNDKVYYNDGGTWVPGVVIKLSGFMKVRYTVRLENGTTKDRVESTSLRRR